MGIQRVHYMDKDKVIKIVFFLKMAQCENEELKAIIKAIHAVNNKELARNNSEYLKNIAKDLDSGNVLIGNFQTYLLQPGQKQPYNQVEELVELWHGPLPNKTDLRGQLKAKLINSQRHEVTGTYTTLFYELYEGENIKEGDNNYERGEEGCFVYAITRAINDFCIEKNIRVNYCWLKKQVENMVANAKTDLKKPLQPLVASNSLEIENQITHNKKIFDADISLYYKEKDPRIEYFDKVMQRHDVVKNQTTKLLLLSLQKENENVEKVLKIYFLHAYDEDTSSDQYGKSSSKMSSKKYATYFEKDDEKVSTTRGDRLFELSILLQER